MKLMGKAQHLQVINNLFDATCSTKHKTSLIRTFSSPNYSISRAN